MSPGMRELLDRLTVERHTPPVPERHGACKLGPTAQYDESERDRLAIEAAEARRQHLRLVKRGAA